MPKDEIIFDTQNRKSASLLSVPVYDILPRKLRVGDEIRISVAFPPLHTITSSNDSITVNVDSGGDNIRTITDGFYYSIEEVCDAFQTACTSDALSHFYI